jgi:hypothetical protein
METESTRFPEGLMLGNWVKTFHPRNSGGVENLKNSCKHAGKIQIKVSLS